MRTPPDTKKADLPADLTLTIVPSRCYFVNVRSGCLLLQRRQTMFIIDEPQINILIQISNSVMTF